MCGFVERNDLFEPCKECVVSDDYIEIAHTFGSRVANEAELFKEQVKKLDIPITVITEADCIPDHYSKDINGKVIAIDEHLADSSAMSYELDRPKRNGRWRTMWRRASRCWITIKGSL